MQLLISWDGFGEDKSDKVIWFQTVNFKLQQEPVYLIFLITSSRPEKGHQNQASRFKVKDWIWTSDGKWMFVYKTNFAMYTVKV